MFYLKRFKFYRHLKYHEICLKIQEFANFGILDVTFEPCEIERFCFLRCVRRPSKPRYRAQIYCSISYGLLVMGISNLVKLSNFDDFDVFGYIWSTRKILTVHDRAINFGSIPRFWGSTNAAQRTESFYHVRFKSYIQNDEISKFLIFFTDFTKFQMLIKFEPFKIEQNFLALYLCFKGLAIH